MKYEGMIMWLERLKDRLLMKEESAMADVIDDAISVIKLHSPEKPVMDEQGIEIAALCPNCGNELVIDQEVCERCTQVIDWGGEDDR